MTLASCLQQEALYIQQFGKHYPDSGTLVKLLNSFAKRMVKKFTEQENALVLISIFTDIALESPKTYRNILQIISFLLDKFSTTDEREKIVEFIYKKFQRLTNIGELQIWLQRITFKLPHPIEYSEKICKIVANIPDVHLWNNEWVKASFKAGFPETSICNDELRDELTPIIDIEEVSLFDEYV